MTIKEIAQLAGVSSAAVSRYLNGGYISEEKKEKIKSIIEQTGYQPSAQARMLRTKRACLVGVVVPKINSESISRVTAGIEQVLSERGYQMLLASTDNQPKVPVVVIGQYTKYANCVYHDDYGAGKAMGRMVAASAAGSGKVAYIGVTRDDKAVGASRADGFFAGLRSGGISVDEEYVRMAEFTMESGYRTALDLLKEKSDIDIISCATDTIAAGAIEALLACAREQVPASAEKSGTRMQYILHTSGIRVTGFGDNQFLKAVTGGIPTVHFGYKTSGIRGAELLLDVVERGEKVPIEMKLGYRLVNAEGDE